VLLAAGGAPFQVRAQAGDSGVGVTAGRFELHVARELVEADVAADFTPRRSEEPAERLLEFRSLHQCASSNSAKRTGLARFGRGPSRSHVSGWKLQASSGF
jgi:hypothetical protein